MATAVVRRRILIVDDDDMVRRAMSRELAVEFEVSEACCYEQAVELLEAGTEYAAIVSDFDLGPGPSGLDLLARARELHPNAPRVIVSGSLPQDEVQALFESGLVQLALAKPWPLLGLRKVVRELTATGAHSQPVLTDDERRSDPRFTADKIDVSARFDAWTETREVFALNISRGGIAFRVLYDPTPGDRVFVSLEPPGNTIQLEGAVRHVEAVQVDRRWCHVGVQFQNLDGPREALVNRALDRTAKAPPDRAAVASPFLG